MNCSAFVRHARRLVPGLVAALLLGLTALRATAGIMSPCDNPVVLPDARVQVFILPYRAEGALSPRGRELVTILQRHVLHAALKYHSIAVSELTGDDRNCEFEPVAARVHPKLQAGQSAIFVWGRMFEQRDAMLLQTTLSFATPGRPDVFRWALPGANAQATIATVPPDTVSFASRSIPVAYLEQLQAAQRSARRMHSAPDPASSYWDLPADPEARFGYVVLGVKGDWMQVRLFPEGGEGWVQAHALAGAMDLKGAFPELHFIDGLIGHYQLVQATDAAPAADGHATLAATLASFDRYLELSNGRAESDARALAAVMQGNSVLRAASRPWTVAHLQAAQRYYLKARALAPTSTAANSFALACGSVLCARGACGENAAQLHEAYLDAIARDPSSRELIGNLNTFYGAAQTGMIKVDTLPADLAAQRAVLMSVQEGMQ